MAQTSPETESLPQRNVPQTPPFGLMLLVYNLIAGVGVGCICGGLTGAIHSAIDRISMDVAQSGDPQRDAIMVRVPGGDPMTEIGRGIGHGAWSGAILAFPLFVFTSIWPSLRHPIRMASLCASLAGTIRLLSLLSYPGTQSTLSNLIGLTVVVAVGALSGFLIFWLIHAMEKLHALVAAE